MSMNQIQRVSMDRFGNPQMIVGMKRKTTRSGKETFPRGHVEIKGELYRLEISQANKEGVEAWVTITKLQKRKQVQF